jgi:hypothetical protein
MGVCSLHRIYEKKLGLNFIPRSQTSSVKWRTTAYSGLTIYYPIHYPRGCAKITLRICHLTYNWRLKYEAAPDGVWSSEFQKKQNNSMTREESSHHHHAAYMWRPTYCERYRETTIRWGEEAFDGRFTFFYIHIPRLIMTWQSIYREKLHPPPSFLSTLLSSLSHPLVWLKWTIIWFERRPFFSPPALDDAVSSGKLCATLPSLYY